jgi:hypothetical protein
VRAIDADHRLNRKSRKTFSVQHFFKEIARLEKSREHRLQGSEKKVYHVASPQNSILRSKQFFSCANESGVHVRDCCSWPVGPLVAFAKDGAGRFGSRKS